ncbi:AbrB/MazE/SpoVT family DNA-binding domain-containing protein [Candidatus Woesearchaeota archaeon]|nr:AbrB/MazE/SpoVT family DNA-binding domain-containing protein [Candidatus Woesearchaeota archaeon]
MIIPISRGQQITIPSKYRRMFKMDKGSKIELLKKGNKLIIQPVGEDLVYLFDKAMGIKPKRGMTARQMDELVEDEMLEEP